MIYINENDLKNIGVKWEETISEIEKAVKALGDNDYEQPIKPYLKYGNPKNRIIAMPAYVGNKIDMAGIKWIASYPDNIKNGIPRASSVVVLNNSKTGEVESIINTAYLSIIRTVSVSGLMIKKFMEARDLSSINIGIIGFGPIGKNHFKMCRKIIESKIKNLYLYDIRKIDDSSDDIDEKVIICQNWEDVYENSDILITCTVCDKPYIDKKPKKGALLLNVSLRDFKEEVYQYVKDSLIVDDWEEVCREKTTIEDWHIKYGLKKEDTKSIVDVVNNGCLKEYEEKENIMFNPMGMGIFDITIGTYYYRKSIEKNIGRYLE